MDAYTVLVLLRPAPAAPAAAIPGHEFLMVQNRRRGLTWELPGGRCEPRELPVDCARRECLEETGCELLEARLLEERTSPFGRGYVFWGRLGPPVQNPDAAEIAKTRFFRHLPAPGELSFPEDPHERIFQRLGALTAPARRLPSKRSG